MKKLNLILVVLLAFAPLYRVHAAPVAKAVYTNPPACSCTATDASWTFPNVGTSFVQLTGTAYAATNGFQIFSSPSHGALSNLNATTGSVLYTPFSGYTGTDTFQFKTTDGSNTSSAGTITVTVSSSRTTLTGTFKKSDGSNYTGTAYFQLTEPAAVTSAILPTKQAVTAVLSSGAFSVSLYPSTTLYSSAGKKVYYQIWVRTSYGQDPIGLFDIPASSTTVDLSTLPAVTVANGSLDMQFVSQAAFNAFLGRANALSVSVNGTPVTGGPFSTINVVPGANMSIAGVDNGGGEVGITFSDPTGGTGGTVGSGTSGQAAVYNGSTSVTGKAFAGATRIYKTNATNNGTEWDTLTAGTGMIVTHSTGDITIATTAVTSLNALTGASQGFATSNGTCGSSFSIASSGSTHTFCQPDASATATGVITAAATAQTFAGTKIFTAFNNSGTPLTVKQKASGSDTLQTWQDSSSVTTSETSRYGSWHRTLNAGTSEGTPISFLNNGYIAKFYETSVSDCASSPCKGLRVSIGYTGGTSSNSLSGITGSVDLGESGNLTDANTSSIVATMSHTGSATVTAMHGARVLVSNSAGNLSAGYGVKVEPALYGGAITSLFDFYGKAVDVTSGTLANKYGIYLENQTAGSALNYAIYTNAGRVSFGDALTIRGISAPAVSESGTGKYYYDSSANMMKLSVNGGAYGNVGSFYEGSATLDFGSISANTCVVTVSGGGAAVITVTGAVDGKPLWLGWTNAAHSTGVSYTARISASNTVTVQACNNTGGSIDPTSGTFTARVSQ